MVYRINGTATAHRINLALATSTAQRKLRDGNAAILALEILNDHFVTNECRRLPHAFRQSLQAIQYVEVVCHQTPLPYSYSGGTT